MIEKKKVCFLSIGNISRCPYMQQYTKHMDTSYSVIYWDREGICEDQGQNTFHRFSFEVKPGDTLAKIKGYFGFRKFAQKKLKEENYDVLVVLQTWTAIILTDILTKQFAGKYIVDIRDYTYENNKVIYGLEKRLVSHSLYNVISSPGYKAFLPDADYLVSHNTRPLQKDAVSEIRGREKNKSTLNIAFIGYVNYHEQQKKLMLALKNDPRYMISFIGTRAMELESFCKENDIKNVTLIDTFSPSVILELYKNVDFINNLYGNHTPVLDYALSNKLYFSGELAIPILVCRDTYMAKVSQQYGLGLTVDEIDSKLGDILFDYYTQIDWAQFENCCDRFLDDVAQENQKFNQLIGEALS